MRTPLRYCHVKMCHMKILHKCMDCDRDFCTNHWAKRSTWGNFWISEEGRVVALIQIPYRNWMYLVCQECSKRDHQLSWSDFVKDYPYFIKFVKIRSNIELCWKYFKEQRNLESWQEKSRWAKIFFPHVTDHLQLESYENLENEFPWTSLFPQSTSSSRSFSL